MNEEETLTMQADDATKAFYKRLRIWGIKNGRRVYIDQQGPSLVMDPEIATVRASTDVEAAALTYLDAVIDVWRGVYANEKELKARADQWNRHEGSAKYTSEDMRAMEYADFVRSNQFPPGSWANIEAFLSNKANPSRSNVAYTAPHETLQCRECLKPCEWIWYQRFPGPRCGSAGWVAICPPCKSWYRELRVVIS